MLRPCIEIGLGHLPVEAAYYVRSQCFVITARSLNRPYNLCGCCGDRTNVIAAERESATRIP